MSQKHSTAVDSTFTQLLEKLNGRNSISASTELNSGALDEEILASFSRFLAGLIDLLKDGSDSFEQAAALGTEDGKLRARIKSGIAETLQQYQALQEDIFNSFGPDIHVEIRSRIRRWFIVGSHHAVSAIEEIMYQRIEEERKLREILVLAMAHDLRSPLTSIRTNAELMCRNPERVDRIGPLAMRIISGVDRLDRLVSNIHDAHRIRGGAPLQLRFKETNLATVLNTVLDDLRGTRGDRFVTRFSGNCIGFWSPDALERVIENLLTNALKYGASNAPIVIEAREIPEPEGRAVEFSVTNQGNPIPASELGTIFQLFSRGASAHQSGISGWGIGLVVVHALVEAHGGRVLVESSAESGTTFIVRLPRDSRLMESEQR